MDLFVDNGASLTLNNNLSVSKSFTNSSGGTLNCGANVISGAGTFTLSSGATLGIGSTAGISPSGSSGNIQTTTRNYNSAANYAYNGTAPQVTGAGLPSAVTNLTINNSAGVTLSATTTVNGTLTLASGQLLTSAYQLNLSATGSVAGGGAGSYVNGLMQRALSAAGGQSLTFPIGDATEYAPVTLANWNVTTAGSLSAQTTAGDHPSVSTSGLDRQPQREPLLDADGGRRVGRQRRRHLQLSGHRRGWRGQSRPVHCPALQRGRLVHHHRQRHADHDGDNRGRPGRVWRLRDRQSVD